MLGAQEWANAIDIGPLTQQFPLEGAAPLDLTRVRIRFDDRTLYVGFECSEDPVSVVARLSRRDTDNGSDAVTIDLGTQGDAQRAFHFSLNAAGVQLDGIRTGDAAVDISWDVVWSSATAQTTDGWSAELALPLTALRFARGSEHAWRWQFRRFVAARNETDAWVVIPRSEHGEMLRYRALSGLPAFDPPRGLELRPFAVMRGRVDTHAPAADIAASAGFDGRLALSTAVSLDEYVPV